MTMSDSKRTDDTETYSNSPLKAQAPPGKDPSKQGYRVLAILAGQSRKTAAVVSELRAHPACRDVSEIGVTRTLRALRQTGLVTRGDDREWIITAEGRAVERAERTWRMDHAADHRLWHAEPRTTEEGEL